MRYALISDIHGNYPALRAILEDVKSANIDKYIFAGDYYMCLPYPNEVIDTVKTCPHSYAVRGNEEDRIDMLSKKDKSTWTDGQFQALYWYYNEISNENRTYLTELPRSIVIDEYIYVSHRSSEFIGNVEMEMFSTNLLQPIFKNRMLAKEDMITALSEKLDNDTAFHKRLADLNDGVYIFGHTHIQWHKQYGDTWFINPGSSGFPMDFTGGAPYTILEMADNGIAVHERRVKYDENQCVNDLLHSSLYRQDKVWNEIMIREFKTHHEFLMHFLTFAEEYANTIGDSTRPYSRQTWMEAYTAWCNKSLSD